MVAFRLKELEQIVSRLQEENRSVQLHKFVSTTFMFIAIRCFFGLSFTNLKNDFSVL